MPRRKTPERFIEEVYNLVGNNYEVLDEYINAKTKIRFKHNKCGDIFLQRPADFLNGHMCRSCAYEKSGNKRKKTHEEFEREVRTLSGNDYLVVGKYINSAKKINMLHKTCGKVFSICPKEFLRGQRCSHCFKAVRKTQEEFEQEVSEIYGNEYSVIGKYKSANTKIKVKHNVCGNIYMVTPAHLLNNRRCPRCFPKGERKDTITFQEEIERKYNGKYEVLSEYKTAHDKVLLKHVKCGYEFKVKPNHALTRTICCPKCDKSVGEILIASFLEKEGVNFISQKKFDDCKNINPLPFDFYVEDKLLIEFDGEQHFRPCTNWGGEKGFLRRKKHDEIKNKFAKQNNIPLIRIPYWDIDNVEDILKKELDKYGLLKSLV